MLAGGYVMAFGSVVLGQAATMPALVSPVTLSSIATAITTYGGAALLAWAGVYVVFRIIKRFIRGTASAVDGGFESGHATYEEYERSRGNM